MSISCSLKYCCHLFEVIIQFDNWHNHFLQLVCNLICRNYLLIEDFNLKIKNIVTIITFLAGGNSISWCSSLKEWANTISIRISNLFTNSVEYKIQSYWLIKVYLIIIYNLLPCFIIFTNVESISFLTF